jgi:hypothetical protein
MQLATALKIALTLRKRPEAVRWMSRMPLPSGVTQLLEVATGDLIYANAVTTPSPQILQSAAIFFIEQVLFTPEASSYRILGCQQASTRRELRRHMVLLIKLLHPDSIANKDSVDRSLYIHRVTRAWHDLKDSKQRAAYDQMLGQSYVRNNSQSDHHRERQAALENHNFVLPASLKKFSPAHKSLRSVEERTLFSRLSYFMGWQL